MPDSRRKPSTVGSDASRTPHAERARARWLHQAQGGRGVRGRPLSAAPAPPPQATRPRLNVSILFLYLLVAISLSLNVLLIWQLTRARDMVYQTLEQLVVMTEDIEKEVISVPIHIEKEFPVHLSVPFEYSDTFPVSETVPISDTFTVPFEVMDTTIQFPVPVKLEVPVNLEVPVSLSKTFDISTTVPIELDMDVNVKLADTPIPGYLSALHQIIQELKFP
jgi:hypothetical protein